MRDSRRSASHVQIHAAVTPPSTPATSGISETSSVMAVVPTAPIHRVASRRTMSAAYPTAAPAPISPPAMDRTAASVSSCDRMKPARAPTADSNPTSRTRCSTPSLKNSATSTSAETTMKKLK